MEKRFLYGMKQSILVKQWDKVLLLGVFGMLLVFVPATRLVRKIPVAGNLFTRELPFTTPEPAPYPVNATGIYPGTEISAQAALVYDLESGIVLFGRNPETSLSPASTTKIMTAIVALEHYDPDEVVTISTVANDGQTMGLVPGERITVENLLYGALIQSGNDAAWALAEHFPGGEPAFVKAMNTKAKELNLTATNFTNPVGYDDPAHKMSASDLTRLAAYALKNRTITKIVAIPQITISDADHVRYHALENVNALLGKIPGVAGIKTGWTEEAGENLVTLVERDGHRVITVVLKSQNRFSDTETLIGWVFANYRWEKIAV